MIGSRSTKTLGPKKVVRIGQIALSIGSLFLLASITPTLASVAFLLGLFIVGAGFGMLASQLGNVNMSAAPQGNTSEVGGLQGTYQNLGASFGTALAGSIFMLMLSSGFTSSISSANIASPVKESLVAQSQSGLAIIAPSEAQLYLIDAGVNESDAEIVTNTYQDAQIEALRTTMFVVFIVSLFAVIASRNLPTLRK